MTYAERLLWAVLVEAESFAMSCRADDVHASSALEIVAQVRHELKDKFGVDLDELGATAGGTFDALLEMKQCVRAKYDAVNLFHLHLDACARCEKQPFNLCPLGKKLLERTGVRP